MRYLTSTLCLLSVSILGGGMAQAQDTSEQDVNAAEATVAPASGEEWFQFSNTDRTLYLIDLKGAQSSGGVVSIRIARVPVQGDPTDLSYRLDEYEIRCRDNQDRMIAEVEFDENGQESERYPEADSQWEPMRPASLTSSVKPLVCDGHTLSGSPAPSVIAYIQSQRR